LKREHFDGIITMYHDQGQIAMKLLSFDGGVTVQGGLPLPVATPAHGTAFDIAGKNKADVTSTQNAFDIATTMAERKISKNATSKETHMERVLTKHGEETLEPFRVPGSISLPISTYFKSHVAPCIHGLLFWLIETPLSSFHIVVVYM
jgi:hypothetical protein